MKVKIKPMTPGVPRAARVRAYAASAVITLGLAAAAMKAWALQIDDGAHYRSLAERQHAIIETLPAPRGEVTDVHGRPLAVSADADSVWANPREVRGKMPRPWRVRPACRRRSPSSAKTTNIRLTRRRLIRRA